MTTKIGGVITSGFYLVNIKYQKYAMKMKLRQRVRRCPNTTCTISNSARIEIALQNGAPF